MIACIAGAVVSSGFDAIAYSYSCGYFPRAVIRGCGVNALKDVVQAEFYFGYCNIVGGGSGDRDSGIAFHDTAICWEGDRHARWNLISNSGWRKGS